MVTLSKLLERVDLQLPNTADIGSKVAYLADAMRKLAPYLGARACHEWETQVGTSEYPLPEGCGFGAVISLETRAGDGQPWQVHNRCRSKQPTRGFCFYDAGRDDGGANMIGIAPVPQAAAQARVIYSAMPVLDESRREQSLSIPDGAAEAMVMYACSMLCSTGGAPDVALANLYRRHYSDALIRFAESVSRERANKPVRRENPWW